MSRHAKRTAAPKTPHVHRFLPFPSDERFSHCSCGATQRVDRISDNLCVQRWGRGPEGKQCRDCTHLRRRTQSKTWYKCALRSDLTHSDRTDQRVGWEACARFEQAREAGGDGSE